MCKLLIPEVNLDRWAAWHCSLAIRFSTATLLAWLFFLALGKTNKYVHPRQTTGSFKKLWRARFSSVQNPSTVCSNQLQFCECNWTTACVYLHISSNHLLLGLQSFHPGHQLRHAPAWCSLACWMNSFGRNGTVFNRNPATHSLPNPEKNITLN